MAVKLNLQGVKCFLFHFKKSPYLALIVSSILHSLLLLHIPHVEVWNSCFLNDMALLNPLSLCPLHSMLDAPLHAEVCPVAHILKVCWPVVVLDRFSPCFVVRGLSKDSLVTCWPCNPVSHADAVWIFLRSWLFPCCNLVTHLGWSIVDKHKGDTWQRMHLTHLDWKKSQQHEAVRSIYTQSLPSLTKLTNKAPSCLSVSWSLILQGSTSGLIPYYRGYVKCKHLTVTHF